MLDSTTWEEATARLRHADLQRRRWLKGYAQTGLVYTRHPRDAIRRMGLVRWLFFVLIMLGTPISLLLSPIFWGTTVAYFLTHSTTITHLFPPPLYYLGTAIMVLGNVALFQQLVAACLKRGGYGCVKYMALVPAWWLFTSWSAYAMLFELVRRPHHWHKTKHGHDLSREEYVAANMPLAAAGTETGR
jgi:cellulose synthase/poly-beta-1,6-N-acetylglucosamine synthase-like glycosyltransferase